MFSLTSDILFFFRITSQHVCKKPFVLHNDYYNLIIRSYGYTEYLGFREQGF